MTRGMLLLTALSAGALAACSALRVPAKTTVAAATVEKFASLHALLLSLPPDEEMRKNLAALRHTPGRLAVEQRNVEVEVWVYGVAREIDDDYHMMLGSSPERPAEFMTAEITRVPSKSDDHAALRAVRREARAIFGRLTAVGIYKRLKPPLRVRIAGSLFYDIDHRPGHVGPRDIAPVTSWEIHPVTTIEELPPAGQTPAVASGDRAR